ncbi:MAG: family 16 glycoside hydrolase [Rubripirellula sp.]
MRSVRYPATFMGCCLVSLLSNFECWPQQATDLTETLPDAGKLANGNRVAGGWNSLLGNPSTWGFGKTYWEMNAGEIHGDYECGKPHRSICTKTKYGDFQLHAMFRMTGDDNANPGNCIWFNRTSADNAPRYQVDREKGYSVCMWEQGGDKMVGAFLPLFTDQLVKHHDWNHHYVVARVHHIQAWLNRVKTGGVVHGGCLQGSFTFQSAHGKRHATPDVKTLLVKPLGDAKGEVQ